MATPPPPGSLPIALGLLLAGVLGGACSRAAPELILPVSNWPGYEYFYLAELNDLAAAEGLRLRTAEFPDPQAIVHAFLRGELQLAQLTTVEAVDICSRAPDRCPVVVLVLDESRGAIRWRPGPVSAPWLSCAAAGWVSPSPPSGPTCSAGPWSRQGSPSTTWRCAP